MHVLCRMNEKWRIWSYPELSTKVVWRAILTVSNLPVGPFHRTFIHEQVHSDGQLRERILQNSLYSVFKFYLIFLSFLFLFFFHFIYQTTDPQVFFPHVDRKIAVSVGNTMLVGGLCTCRLIFPRKQPRLQVTNPDGLFHSLHYPGQSEHNYQSLVISEQFHSVQVASGQWSQW